MQINQTAEQQNDPPEDHTVTPSGSRPVKVGAMGLVRGLAFAP